MNDVWSGMPGLGQGLDLSQTMDGSLEARSVSWDRAISYECKF